MAQSSGAFSVQPMWGGEPLVPREEDDETVERLYLKLVGNCVNGKFCSSSYKGKKAHGGVMTVNMM